MFFEMQYDLESVNKMFDAFPGVVKEATVAKVTEAVKYLERVIKTDPDFPYGAGPLHLIQTISSDVSYMGEEVTGIVGTPAKYAEAVEYGTKPHFPPLEPLQYWVEKKLGLPEKEAKSVAFLIARKISVKGTEGSHMFEFAWEENKDRVEKMLNEIADEVVRRL
jgi:hypothetical protein